MSPLIIQIDWPYFLGVVATLVGVVWYSGTKFSSIETSVEWIKETIKRLEGRMDQAFGQGSPTQLLPKGIEVLEKSGLKDYIANNKEMLISRCGFNDVPNNAYDIQQRAFECFDDLDFGDFETNVKNAAYEYGMSISVVRRIGGIHLRDIILTEKGLAAPDTV